MEIIEWIIGAVLLVLFFYFLKYWKDILGISVFVLFVMEFL